MDMKTVKTGAIYTVAFVVAVFALKFILKDSPVIQQNLKGDPSFLFFPSLAASSTLYAASLLNLFMTGELTFPIVKNIRRLAFGLFLSLTIAGWPASEGFNSLGPWILMSSIVLVLNRIADAFSESYNHVHIKVVSTSASLLAAGYIAMNLVGFASPFVDEKLFPNLETPVFISFAALSALSLLGSLEGFRSPYASYLRRTFAKSTRLVDVFFLLLIASLYFYDWRPLIVADYPTYVGPAEWAIVCLAAVMIYMNARAYVAKSLAEEQVLGDWARLVQKIAFSKGSVEELSKVVHGFLEDGSKEGILVNLISGLAENGVTPFRIEAVVGELVEYDDVPEPRLMFNWTQKNLERQNRLRRLNVLHSTLEEVGATVGIQTSAITILKGDVERATK